MKKVWFSFSIFFIFLMGCQLKSIEQHYYMHLMGESENWYVKNYEIELNPEYKRAGNGTVVWKGQVPLETDSFLMRSYVLINGEAHALQGTAISGDSVIKEQTTGELTGGTILNQHGDPLTLDDIEEIYMVIEWWDDNHKEHLSEQIYLYRKTD